MCPIAEFRHDSKREKIQIDGDVRTWPEKDTRTGLITEHILLLKENANNEEIMKKNGEKDCVWLQPDQLGTVNRYSQIGIPISPETTLQVRVRHALNF